MLKGVEAKLPIVVIPKTTTVLLYLAVTKKNEVGRNIVVKAR